jgi:hypothetical protein
MRHYYNYEKMKIGLQLIYDGIVQKEGKEPVHETRRRGMNCGVLVSSSGTKHEKGRISEPGSGLLGREIRVRVVFEPGSALSKLVLDSWEQSTSRTNSDEKQGRSVMTIRYGGPPGTSSPPTKQLVFIRVIETNHGPIMWSVEMMELGWPWEMRCGMHEMSLFRASRAL